MLTPYKPPLLSTCEVFRVFNITDVLFVPIVCEATIHHDVSPVTEVMNRKAMTRCVYSSVGFVKEGPPVSPAPGSCVGAKELLPNFLKHKLQLFIPLAAPVVT